MKFPTEVSFKLKFSNASVKLSTASCLVAWGVFIEEIKKMFFVFLLKLRGLSIKHIRLLLINIPSGIFFESLRPLLCCSHFNLSLASRGGGLPQLDSVEVKENRLLLVRIHIILSATSPASSSASSSIFISSSSVASIGKRLW